MDNPEIKKDNCSRSPYSFCFQFGAYASSPAKHSLGNEHSQPKNVACFREDEEYRKSTESDEEELEAPLPLMSEEDWLHYNHQYGLGHSFCSTTPCSYPAPSQPAYLQPAPCQATHSWHTRHSSAHASRPQNPQNPQFFMESACGGSTPTCGVSVNIPYFSLPPAGGVSQTNLRELKSGSLTQEKRGAGLPEKCTIFITYSSDAASEIVPFAEFLTKQGFRTTIDRPDMPVNCLDIGSWKDGFLKDPSTLIIVAISPKYKADVEGLAVDSHAKHTKYIYTMMQNEFILQGSLNFRFIPVLFLNASKEHVPKWLQNTIVYHWPLQTEDLLLRLLKRERYDVPPVATKIGIIIRPVQI